VARLPRGDVLARLGPVGAALHLAACGEDAAPLVPAAKPAAFGERLDLEWPIEGLEPLSFVLARMCESLEAALERADRGAVGLTTRLRLVTRVVHTRTLQLPAPIRDARVLRTLILLDLESHPPPAALDVVEIALEVTPGRIEQGSLLARTLPAPESLTTLLARLGALMGASRVGAPAVVDTHDERAMAMRPFSVTSPGKGPRPGDLRPAVALVVRRCRCPIPARVEVAEGTPVRVEPSSRDWPGGQVVIAAGPWRSSGQWWRAADAVAWDRDEWDVEIAGGVLYRLARDRGTGRWEIDAVVD
jgi:protein ImuB